MHMTERVKEIIELNKLNFYIPLAIQGDHSRMFPMYSVRIMEENTLAFPATDATGIDQALKESTPAQAMVVDRAGGYEAYLLEGNARYVSDEMDYTLVSEMRNEMDGFPIHGAVVFEVKNVYLVPPP